MVLPSSTTMLARAVRELRQVILLSKGVMSAGSLRVLTLDKSWNAALSMVTATSLSYANSMVSSFEQP